MKSGIISLALVDVICIAFIFFTVISQFGTNIKVYEREKAYPVEYGSFEHTLYRRGYGSSKIYQSAVKMQPADDDIDTFWVVAEEVFGTDDEHELKELIEEKEEVRLNIFVNPETGKVIGSTTKGTSKFALIYNDNKLVKYGLIIIPAVNVFVIILIVISEKVKKKNQKKQV